VVQHLLLSRDAWPHNCISEDSFEIRRTIMKRNPSSNERLVVPKMKPNFGEVREPSIALQR